MKEEREEYTKMSEVTDKYTIETQEKSSNGNNHDSGIPNWQLLFRLVTVAARSEA
jgi:hypothetical protein